MKKLGFLAVFVVCLGLLAGRGFAADNTTHIYLDGKELDLSSDRQVRVEHQSIMIPIRVVVEELGYKIDWNPKNGLITIQQKDKVLKLVLNQSVADVNGKSVTLIAPPMAVNEITFVPLRFVGEQMGLKVAWNNKTRSATLQSQTADSTSKDNIHNSGGSATAPSTTNSEQVQTAASLTDLSFADNRLTLTVSGQVKPVVTVLGGPDRIVIDLPDVKYGQGFGDKYALDNNLKGEVPVSDNPDVSKVRYAVFSRDPYTIRIVLDLNSPQSYQFQNAGDGSYVLDIKTASSPSSNSSASSTPASVNDMFAQGIDVSHHNGVIDWQQVAADGRSFVFIKASQGKTFRDSQFAANVQGAKDAGLLVGVYHFLDATTTQDAKLQAANFAQAIEEAGGISQLDLPPVMDYEDNPGKLTAAQIRSVAHAFLDEVERLTGCQPMIYTGNAFGANFDTTFSGYKIWMARYSSQEPKPVAAWDRWDIWQYSSSGSVPGITGSVDLNVYQGTLEELRAQMALNQP
ncbi:1,4-beta-N-acetylmuramidase [Paenibacillus sp. CAA11]|uniref:GH25 family lysozyme n=1 Tax=Paenibacillus sp. CAA11 TaxID=1532905 RepID=UPI000D36C685|nr:GH25 family lysozyme [Paenibacillus sp. CAA11]AWB44104.1 1,4-beta-N-acetylmuramidase [Paenibacillus sp. CAA11]